MKIWQPQYQLFGSATARCLHFKQHWGRKEYCLIKKPAKTVEVCHLIHQVDFGFSWKQEIHGFFPCLRVNFCDFCSANRVPNFKEGKYIGMLKFVPYLKVHSREVQKNCCQFYYRKIMIVTCTVVSHCVCKQVVIERSSGRSKGLAG